ncbi:MAG: flagellar biosynthetic protein FliO [Lysinibacillus sp.]
MRFLKSLRITMIFAFLVTFSFLYPAHSEVYAVDCDSLMIDEGYSKNKEECEDNKKPAAEEDSTVSAAGNVSAWEYIKMVLALVFVIALFYALIKFLNKRNLKYQHNQMVQNLGGLSLGAQKSVQLLQVGDSLYLVGVGDDIQLLKEITNEEEVLAHYNGRQEFAAASPYIAEVLSKFKKKPNQKVDEKADDSSFGDLFEKKMNEIKQERSEEIDKWKQKENDKK